MNSTRAVTAYLVFRRICPQKMSVTAVRSHIPGVIDEDLQYDVETRTGACATAASMRPPNLRCRSLQRHRKPGICGESACQGRIGDDGKDSTQGCCVQPSVSGMDWWAVAGMLDVDTLAASLRVLRSHRWPLAKTCCLHGHRMSLQCLHVGPETFGTSSGIGRTVYA